MSVSAPIFVLGTTRSGTSALHLALLSALKHKGFGEGHFFETIKPMLDCATTVFATPANSVSGTFMYKIGIDAMKEEIRELYRSIYLKYLGESFIDKTPTLAAIQTAALIHEVFPDAKIIYMQRRGIENVLSKVRKFPEQKFEAACREWCACIQTWRQVNSQLKHYIEIEQYRMKQMLDTEFSRLQSYLELEEEELNQIKKFLLEKDIEKTSTSDVVDFDSLAMTDEQRKVFLNLCGKVMEQERYSLTESYFV